MQLIAGLGNPGRPYAGTPHNLGFEVVEELARRWGLSWREVTRLHAKVARRTAAASVLMLAKPLTYMNRSGMALAAIARFYSLSPRDVLVVVDDVNLPLGRLRLRRSGTDGGHNGLKSVIQHLGTNAFPRLRLGCAPPEDDPRDRIEYVLGRLGAHERAWAERVVDAAADAVESVLDLGFDPAMSRVNHQEIPPPGSPGGGGEGD